MCLGDRTVGFYKRSCLYVRQKLLPLHNSFLAVIGHMIVCQSMLTGLLNLDR